MRQDKDSHRKAGNDRTASRRLRKKDKRKMETRSGKKRHGEPLTRDTEDEELPAAPATRAAGKRRAQGPPRVEDSDEEKDEEEDDSDRDSARTTQDARSTWVPGQWKAWKEHQERELKANDSRDPDQRKKLKDIVKEFSQVEQARGWVVHSEAAIRSQKRRMGEADATYLQNPMTEADRKRARALFEEHKKWDVATKEFNKETGRNMNKSQLIAAARRAKPDAVSEATESRGRRLWVEEEVEKLKTLTNYKSPDFAKAYQEFNSHMKSVDPDYQPRTWKAFLKELGQVRQAVVETGKPGLVERGWKKENDAVFTEMAGTHSSKTAFVKAAAAFFGCSQAFVRQLFQQRQPRLKSDGGDHDMEEPVTGEDAARRPQFREDDQDDAEPGITTPAEGMSAGEEDNEEEGREESPLPVIETVSEPQAAVQALISLSQKTGSDQVDPSETVGNPDRISEEPNEYPVPGREEPGPSPAVTSRDTEPAPDQVDDPGHVRGNEPNQEGLANETSQATEAPGRGRDQLRAKEIDEADGESQQGVVTEGTISDRTVDAADTSAEVVDADQGDQEEDKKPANVTNKDQGDQEETKQSPKEDEQGDGWETVCEYTAQTPWVTEPSTPRRSDDSDRNDDAYAPQRWAYDVPDESAPQPSVTEEVDAREEILSDSESEPFDTLEDMLNYNKRRGIDVRQVEWVKMQEVADHRQCHYLVDSIALEATRDPERTMNRGPLYSRFLQEWGQSLLDAQQENRHLPRPDNLRYPALSWRRLTEMVLMVCATCEYVPYNAILMRHFGPRRGDATAFGKCCGKTCCLNVDFGVNNLCWTLRCRHWQLFSNDRVYMEDFESAEDYRLTMALSSVLQASNQVKMRRKELAETADKGGEPPYRVTIDVIGVMPTMQFFERWDCAVTRPYAKMILECMTVVIPGTGQYGSLRMKFREATKPTTFGKVQARGREFDAVLCRYDGQDFWLVNAALDVAARWDSVVWIAEERLLTHARRCGVLEDCLEIPILRNLAMRETGATYRVRSVQEKIDQARFYQEMKRSLDPAQLRALDAAVRYTGIVPVRGPFGCGKTRLIAAIIGVTLKTFPNFRIFVTSETNSAIDEDLRRVVEDGVVPHDRILRLGEPSRSIENKYLQFFLSERVKKQEELLGRTLRGRLLRERVRCYEERVVQHASVVFGTTATFGREQYRDLQNQVVINDEGAQTLESALVQALRKTTMTLIPLGDANQLTARLEIPEDMIERFEAGDRRHKLGWSTIHALAYRRDRFPGATLTTQYRSHVKIGSWLSGFYDFEVEQQGPRSPDYLSRVVIGVKEDSEPWEYVESQVEMQTARVALITCAHEGLRRDRSIYTTDDVNRVEIWKTIEILMQVVREWKA